MHGAVHGSSVIPAPAGNQFAQSTPLAAKLDSRLRGNDSVNWANYAEGANRNRATLRWPTWL